jgi:hypothetical protein
MAMLAYAVKVSGTEQAEGHMWSDLSDVHSFGCIRKVPLVDPVEFIGEKGGQACKLREHPCVRLMASQYVRCCAAVEEYQLGVGLAPRAR